MSFLISKMKTTRNDQVICQWIAKNRASPVGEVILDHGKMILHNDNENEKMNIIHFTMEMK